MSEPRTTGSVQRDFVEHDHPEGAYTLSAHRVTESTQGLVPTSSGINEYAPVGSYLVETQRPGVYEIHSADGFEGMGLVAVRDQEDLTDSDEEEVLAPKFDPNEADAATVRRYLRRADIDDAERNRVIRAERDGANRKSAIPQGMDVTDGDDDSNDDGDDEGVVVVP
jgi:hypothetical protein